MGQRWLPLLQKGGATMSCPPNLCSCGRVDGDPTDEDQDTAPTQGLLFPTNLNNPTPTAATAGARVEE